MASAVAGAATARHVVETAASGNVQAEFSYDYDAQNFRFSNLHLTVRRSGAAAL